MSIVLFDNIERKKLFPLDKTCAIADLRTGVFTSEERWSFFTGEKVFVHTADYLSQLYEPIPDLSHYWIDATVLADEDLMTRILLLNDNEALADSKGMVAGKKAIDPDEFHSDKSLSDFETVYEAGEVKRLEYPWHLFQYNDIMLRADIAMIISKMHPRELPANNHYIQSEHIFIEDGASVDYSTINASAGPVYIGKNAVIMEGCLIRGPFALCESAILKMGTKIYGATTIGPNCTAGGEIKNTIMQAYSNKAHDGYLGDAVIGKWCNLGAGTSNSNVKNTAGVVKMWNAFKEDFLPVDMKCGIVMGDYSRTAINSSLNTGSMIGVCANVFGEGLLPKYIPDFQWGTKGITRYEFEKCLKDIDNWKKMKGHALTDAEKKILKHIFETS